VSGRGCIPSLIQFLPSFVVWVSGSDIDEFRCLVYHFINLFPKLEIHSVLNLSQIALFFLIFFSQLEQASAQG